MNKIIATLALVLAAGTAHAKQDAPRDMYMCYTAHQVSVDLLESKGLHKRNAEFRDNLKEIYNFKQERLDITYENFKTSYDLMFKWVDEPQKLGLPANYCWKRPA